jgi:hypothetical protein
MYKLENWEITGDNDPFIAPECQKIYITGEIYNHPGFLDGTRITTSSIQGVEDNNIVITKNSKYELGEPDVVYVEWCRENNCHVPTKDEPIKVW